MTDDFPARVRELREEKGYCQEELAKLANTSRKTISRVEQGMLPSLQVADSIMRALGGTYTIGRRYNGKQKQSDSAAGR